MSFVIFFFLLPFVANPLCALFDFLLRLLPINMLLLQWLTIRLTIRHNAIIMHSSFILSTIIRVCCCCMQYIVIVYLLTANCVLASEWACNRSIVCLILEICIVFMQKCTQKNEIKHLDCIVDTLVRCIDNIDTQSLNSVISECI